MRVQSKSSVDGDVCEKTDQVYDPIPLGWVTAKINKVFELKYGKSLPQEKRDCGGTTSVYGSNGVVGVHSHGITYGPTIVVGRKGSVGEVHLSTEECWPIDTTYFIDDFRCDLPPAYWALFLKSLRLGREEKSSAIPGLNRDDIYGVSIVLPPIAEQRRIVAKLEMLLGKVSSSQQRLSRIPGLLKRFRQSVLAAACSGKLTADWRRRNAIEHDWKRKRLMDVIDALEQGWSPKCETFPSESQETWGVIKTTAIQPLKFYEAENKRLPDSFEPKPHLCISEGDLLITRAGPRIRAGVCCYVESCRDRLIVCDKAYRFRALPDKSDGRFLSLILNSPAVLDDIEQMKTGISDSGVNLTQHKFHKLEFSMPSLPEQQEIVRRVEKLFAFADRIEARLQQAQSHVDRLTQSILAKAFRGELVPTEAELARREGRSYESASELLDRIRVARSDAQPTKPKKQKK